MAKKGTKTYTYASFSDTLKEARYDKENYDYAFYGRNEPPWYRPSYSGKKPSKAAEVIRDLGERINETTLKHPSGCLAYLASQIVGAVGGIGLTVLDAFKKCDATWDKAKEATTDKVIEFTTQAKAEILEKHPYLAEKIQDLNGSELVEGLKEFYNSIYTEVSDKQIEIKDGMKDFFIDVRSNGLISNVEDGIHDIIESAVQNPSITDLLISQDGILWLVAVAGIPAMLVFGLEAVGHLATDASIYGKHIYGYIKERVLPNSTTTK